MIYYTVVSILLSEVIFWGAENIINRRRFLSGFATTILLGLYVGNVSFVGALLTLFDEVRVSPDGGINGFVILLFFVNMGYGFLRGMSKIADINKRHGNL